MTPRYQGSLIIASLIVVLMVFLLGLLGTWQLSRMVEKQAVLKDIAAKQQGTAENFAYLVGREATQPNMPVSLSGKVLPQWQWLLDNQLFEGQVGYQVLSGVQTANGIVLVNFGWIAGSRVRSEWPDVTLPSELSKVQGVVTAPSDNPFVNSSVAEKRYQKGQQVYRIQAVNTAQQAQQSGLALLPQVVLLTESSATFSRRWTPVNMPPEKHLAYAIQWFGLAIAAGVIGGLVIRKARRKHVE